jgi:hypothetical protein
MYNVGKKRVAHVACMNSSRVVAREVNAMVTGMSLADPDGGDSCFTFDGFVLAFDAADFFGSGADEFLESFGLTRGAFGGVVSLSDPLSMITYWN